VVRIDKWGDKGKYEGIDVDSRADWSHALYPLLARPMKVVIVPRVNRMWRSNPDGLAEIVSGTFIGFKLDGSAVFQNSVIRGSIEEVEDARGIDRK